MSLVPIIYTSLILFFGLLMVVLIISYTSYKVNAKSNPVIEEEIRKKQKSVYSPKPIIKVKKQNNFNDPNLSYEYKVKNKELIYNPKPVVVPYDYFENKSKNNSSKADVNDVQKTEAYKLVSKTHSSKKRLEIMNDNTKYRTREFENTADFRSEHKKGDLSQINILNFYSDNLDKDLITLNAIPTTQAV